MYYLQTSLLCLIVIGVLVYIAYLIFKHRRSSAFLFLLLYVFGLIFLLRFVVNFREMHPDFGFIENFCDAFLHTLQSFSLDEDYTDYLIKGIKVFGGEASVLAAVYGVVSSLLNICAPILGGAVLLDILMGFFPRMRVALRPWRCKFVFSELNESAVTLAEDIAADRNYAVLTRDAKQFLRLRPLIIFTDAYPDTGSEQRTELFDRAAAIGAICLKTDLKHISLKRSKLVYYFLMDQDEHQNIESANSLLNEPGCRILWPDPEDRSVEKEKKTETVRIPRTRIYVFCQSDYGMTMINNVTTTRAETVKEVLVRPIRDYANMAFNLMVDVPLFLPLTGEVQEPVKVPQRQNGARYTVTPVRELHVTILGAGSIAEEVFKTVYWCGQMAGIQLFIHVVARTAAELKERLENSCPEMLAGCESGSDILKVFPGSGRTEFSPPYAVCDDFIDDVDAERITDYPEELLKKTDYYVVALGSDEKNIYTTSELSRALRRRMLHTGQERCPVIVPVIFDDQLAESVRKAEPQAGNAYILPAGMLRERFSCRNVFMADLTDAAFGSSELYSMSKQEARVKDEYKYWANIARTVHAPYKLFALGGISRVWLREPRARRYEGEAPAFRPGDETDLVQAWMEHRRWNAYLRTQGFTCPSAAQQAGYAAGTLTMKDVPLKLHPCLVEAGPDPFVCPQDGLSAEDTARYDMLDVCSVYDFLLTKILKDKKMDPEDLQYFHDREKLVFETGRKLAAKYGIDLAELKDSEYKQWDSIAFDQGFKDARDTLVRPKNGGRV